MRPVYDLTRMADKRNRLIYPGMQIPEGRAEAIRVGVDIGKRFSGDCYRGSEFNIRQRSIQRGKTLR